MLQKIRSLKAQSTLEYAILIVIIIGALLTLQVYIKRGIQGRLKSATDDIGDQYTTAAPANYFKQTNSYSQQLDTNIKGTAEVNQLVDSTTNTWRYIGTNADSEYWGPR